MRLTLPPKTKIRDCRILVIGDVMLDRYWYGDVSRISPEAPVPIVHFKNEENRMGGAANVALNIKSFGAFVTLVGVVGKDPAAKYLRSLLDVNKIESLLVEDPGTLTIIKLRVIGQLQQILRIDFEKEPDHEALIQVVKHFESLVYSHDVVIFSDYGKGTLTHIDQMIHLARDAKKTILVDPKGTNWDRYRGASVITPNRFELAEVIGAWANEKELFDRSQNLLRYLKLKALLLTRSDEGMSLFQANRVTSIPSHKVEVADVTGAGDTVISTLAIMLASGLDLKSGINWANLAGGLAVQKFGTSAITYDEIAHSSSNFTSRLF